MSLFVYLSAVSHDLLVLPHSVPTRLSSVLCVLVEEVGGLPPGGGDLGPRSAPQRGAHVVGFGQPGDCHAAEPEGHDHDGGDDADWSRGPHAAIDSSAGDSEAATAPRRRSAGRTPDMSTTKCTPAKAALLSVPGDRKSVV